MGLRSCAIYLTHNVGHTSFVANEGCEMRLKFFVVTRERANAATMMLGAFARKEAKGAMAWCTELAVRPGVTGKIQVLRFSSNKKTKDISTKKKDGLEGKEYR